MKNKSFYLMNLMILISFLSLFLSNYIQLWIFMEINSILMILNLSIYNKNKKVSINYLIIQSISSVTLISIMIINYNLDTILLSSIIMLLFFMKLNLFPFFFWLPLINVKLNWMMILLMSTTQKIIPLLLMNLYFNQINNLHMNMICLTSIFSSLTSTILSINELSMKKILTFSSMNHSSWMIFIIMMDKYLFIMYFILYSLSMIFICFILNKYKINDFDQLHQFTFMNKKWILISMTMNFFILSSLPPFLTFLIKFKTLNFMIKNFNNIFILTFLILSILTLIFYMNMIFKIKMIFMFKNKFWLTFNMNMNNNFINLSMILILTFTIFFITEIFI